MYQRPCAPLARVAFVSLSECDLLHKQVTLHSNGLLSHSRTSPHWRSAASCPDDYGDEWERRQLCINHKASAVKERLISLSSSSSSTVQWAWWRSVTAAEEASKWNVLIGDEAEGVHRWPTVLCSRLFLGHIWNGWIRRQKLFASLLGCSYSASHTLILLLSLISLLLNLLPSFLLFFTFLSLVWTQYQHQYLLFCSNSPFSTSQHYIFDLDATTLRLRFHWKDSWWDSCSHSSYFSFSFDQSEWGTGLFLLRTLFICGNCGHMNWVSESVFVTLIWGHNVLPFLQFKDKLELFYLLYQCNKSKHTSTHKTPFILTQSAIPCLHQTFLNMLVSYLNTCVNMTLAPFVSKLDDMRCSKK